MKTAKRSVGPLPWLLLALGIALLSTACSTTIRGWSEESFRSPGLTRAQLNAGGVALLPVIILRSPTPADQSANAANPPAPYAPSNRNAMQGHALSAKNGSGYRIILDEVLLHTLKARWPGLPLVPTGDALKRLNDAGLADAYGRFYNDYPTAGIDGKTLDRFGRALHTRYLLISRAVVSESNSNASVSFIWTFGRRTVLRSVKVDTQIWDTTTQKQVWEGSGVGYNRLSAYEKPPLTEQMATVAMQQMVKNLPH